MRRYCADRLAACQSCFGSVCFRLEMMRYDAFSDTDKVDPS